MNLLRLLAGTEVHRGRMKHLVQRIFQLEAKHERNDLWRLNWKNMHQNITTEKGKGCRGTSWEVFSWSIFRSMFWGWTINLVQSNLWKLKPLYSTTWHVTSNLTVICSMLISSSGTSLLPKRRACDTNVL